MSWRAWLARLAFSFLIIGMWLLYEAYLIQTNRRVGSGGRQIAYVVGGLASVVMGAVGMRLRHGPRD